MSETALMIAPQQGIALSPVMDLATAKQKLREFQEFVADYMRDGEDYGTIPGTAKPTLYKPGADKLCELYGLADRYTVLDKTVDFDRGLFDFEIQCELVRRGDESLISTGLGSCSSFESKYRYRDLQRTCPSCGKQAIIKGKEEYGGGWLCFKKKGGCGAKFKAGDASIESQETGKVQNEDIADLKNTIYKMAKKRAKIDATLAATRSSGVFTQDIEDFKGNAPVEDETQEYVDRITCADCNGEIDAYVYTDKTGRHTVPLEKVTEAAAKDFPGVNLCGGCQVKRHAAKRKEMTFEQAAGASIVSIEDKKQRVDVLAVEDQVDKALAILIDDAEGRAEGIINQVLPKKDGKPFMLRLESKTNPALKYNFGSFHNSHQEQTIGREGQHIILWYDVTQKNKLTYRNIKEIESIDGKPVKEEDEGIPF